jgi:hypothetical protein
VVVPPVPGTVGRVVDCLVFDGDHENEIDARQRRKRLRQQHETQHSITIDDTKIISTKKRNDNFSKESGHKVLDKSFPVRSRVINQTIRIMDRILPEALSAPIALAIEKVYAYGPMAEKTVVLGKRKVLLAALNINKKSFA